MQSSGGAPGRSRPPDVPVPSVEGPEPAPAGSAEDGTDLPEGFFDDPIQDAKARGIEYKVHFISLDLIQDVAYCILGGQVMVIRS